jgi:predicted nucleotidyltransferase
MLLSSLLFTDYRRKVLGLLLLHPEQHYHQREIARLTATVSGTLSRELAKLVDGGLLLKEAVGNQMHYRANRQCPIFEELASILRKTSGLADVLGEVLLPLAGQLQSAFVFGSMASGKAHADSDIDLLLIGDTNFAELISVLYPLQETLGREINPKIYRRAEWQALIEQQGAFIQEVLHKPKVFIIGNEADLLSQGGTHDTGKSAG